MDQNYPDRLNRLNSEIPNNIDDATVWEDGKVYFFKGSKFYRVDEFNEKNANVTINNIADNWKGIPNHNDAVHYLENFGLTFFFKADNFYAFQVSCF